MGRAADLAAGEIGVSRAGLIGAGHQGAAADLHSADDVLRRHAAARIRHASVQQRRSPCTPAGDGESFMCFQSANP